MSAAASAQDLLVLNESPLNTTLNQIKGSYTNVALSEQLAGSSSNEMDGANTSHHDNNNEAALLIAEELRERREECQRLMSEVDSLKNQFQNTCDMFNQNLQEERLRTERLEEQMYDLIELHQNEIENLKQGILDMEEKVQYQSEERMRDVYEMIESCQTRIARMEHQQYHHLQQLVNLDSLDNSNARALLLKLINVLLTVLQVILLLVATLANILTPFLQTTLRSVISITVLILGVILYHKWPNIFRYFEV